SNDLVSSVIDDPIANTTVTSQFNNEGLLQSHTNGSTTTTMTYTSNIQPDLITHQGQTSDIDYDNNGNVVKISLPEGVEHEFTYNSLNDITSYTDPRNNTTTFDYDSNDNLDKVTDNMNFVTDYTFNSSGLLTQVSNPENITTTFGYDAYGNQTAVNAPLSINTNIAYDDIGRATQVTNPKSQVTQYTYDEHDLTTLARRISSGGNVDLSYSYDYNDNLSSITNALGGVTSFTYNNRDLLESMSFGGDTKQYSYRDDNLLDTHTRPDGSTLSYVYDNQGRMTSDGYASYTYDSRNNVKTITKNGTTSFNYDDLDRLEDYNDIYGRTVAYQYDANSNVTRMTYPGGYAVNYTYDDNNRLTLVRFNGNALSIAYEYFDDGRLKKVTYPNNTQTDYGYDAAARMTSLVNKFQNGTVISSYNFTLDALGNHLQENRSEPFTDVPLLSPATHTGTYASDNDIQSFGGSDFTHNANGEQTQKDGRPMVWDIAGMPLEIGERTYTYDGTRLMRKAVRANTTSEYAWDIRGMGNIVVEYDGSGAAKYYYIHGNGLCARVNASNTSEIHYYHFDFRGSTIAMTDAGQNITHKYQYLPFGEAIRCEELDADNRFKYVGQWGVMHEGGNHYYMRARQYDASNGHFLSEDPVWGDNLFEYADSNPITNIDPNGEFPVAAGIIIGAIAIAGAVEGIGDVSEVLFYQTHALKAYYDGDYNRYQELDAIAQEKAMKFHLGNIISYIGGKVVEGAASIPGVKAAVRRAGTELLGKTVGAVPILDMRFNASLDVMFELITHAINNTTSLTSDYLHENISARIEARKREQLL
ncbi:MAG: RHS repeat-associated core domain-containing protein, partial [Bacteroidota bacterium]